MQDITFVLAVLGYRRGQTRWGASTKEKTASNVGLLLITMNTQQLQYFTTESHMPAICHASKYLSLVKQQFY